MALVLQPFTTLRAFKDWTYSKGAILLSPVDGLGFSGFRVFVIEVKQTCGHFSSLDMFSCSLLRVRSLLPLLRRGLEIHVELQELPGAQQAFGVRFRLV